MRGWHAFNIELATQLSTLQSLRRCVFIPGDATADAKSVLLSASDPEVMADHDVLRNDSALRMACMLLFQLPMCSCAMQTVLSQAQHCYYIATELQLSRGSCCR